MFDVSFFVVNMISAMGLALGIDYSLFILSRFREERGRGLEKIEAIVASGATASRAVLFSGIAFVLAMFGMLLVPDTVLRSLALGAILVGIVSVVAALTLAPRRAEPARRPRQRAHDPDHRAPGDRQRRPEGRFWSALVGAGHAAAAPESGRGDGAAPRCCALPCSRSTPGASGLSTLPDRFASKQGFVALNRDFPGAGVDPAQIVVQGNVSSAPVRSAIEQLKTSLAGEVCVRPVDADGVCRRTATRAALGSGRRRRGRVRGDERDPPPACRSDPRGVRRSSTRRSSSAERPPSNVDYFDIVGSWLPIVFAFVLGLSFILLTVAFRSIVIPAVAIVLNLLSVGAAYGLLVLVFQKGIGNELFGFQQVDAIEAWVPLFLFSVLFGLSMDYQVFLLSRIKERYTQTGDTAGAVSFGVGSTARLITGAALIIVAVFGGFAAGDLVMFQQMGFGVAVALLVDATIVRCVLVPASMKLLGERNWYLPSWLSWLPDVHVEGHAAAEPPDRRIRRNRPPPSRPRRPSQCPRPRRVRPYTTRKRKGSMTAVSHTTSLPPAVTLGHRWRWAWPLAALLGFPIGGYVANLTVGAVDSVGPALAGGLIAGAIVGQRNGSR